MYLLESVVYLMGSFLALEKARTTDNEVVSELRVQDLHVFTSFLCCRYNELFVAQCISAELFEKG